MSLDDVFAAPSATGGSKRAVDELRRATYRFTSALLAAPPEKYTVSSSPDRLGDCCAAMPGMVSSVIGIGAPNAAVGAHMAIGGASITASGGPSSGSPSPGGPSPTEASRDASMAFASAVDASGEIGCCTLPQPSHSQTSTYPRFIAHFLS